MKKALVSMLVVLALTACSSETGNTAAGTRAQTTPTTTSAAETQPTATTTPATIASTTAAATTSSAAEAGIGEPIKFEDFAITITGVETAKTYDDKDGVRIKYDFTNLADDAVMPMTTVDITVYQNGVELSSLSVFEDSNDNGMKKIKNDATIKDVQSDHVAEPDDGDLTIEVKPMFSFDDSDTVEFVVEYPED